MIGMTAVIVGLIIGGVAGCKSWDNAPSINALASDAGTVDALLWITLKNPSAAQKTEVIDVLINIQKAVNTVAVTNGTTFSTVVYPLVVAYVAANPKIPAIDKPLADDAALFILNKADLFAATHAAIFNNETEIVRAIDAFAMGAETALQLPATAKAITQTKATCGLNQTK